MRREKSASSEMISTAGVSTDNFPSAVVLSWQTFSVRTGK
jgi:hypothetical protein